MAGTYYKYAERDADAEVNWGVIGKNLSDVFTETNRIREEKKAAYDQQTRENLSNLAAAPQGENQDVNNFTNNYVDIMTKQIQMDEKLFKSGQMKEKNYRIRRQNYVDGTSQLFDLSTLYQEEAAKTMKGIDDGTLQSALTINNMASVEGVSNFNNSTATIDTLGDGRVGVAFYENKIIDGKQVRVLSKNAVPVTVMKGKILHKPLKFQVDATTTAFVDGLGTRKDVLYKAADLSHAGTITELMGPDFLNTLKDPVDIKIVTDMKDSIAAQVDSYFTDPYKLTSILGDELGTYDSNSFTYDKDEAASDSKKILLKINPITNLPTIDDKGPNYKSQKKEASEFVTKQIYSKMDNERSIKPTTQIQLQERRPKTELETQDSKNREDARALAEQVANAITGDPNKVDSALKYFRTQGIDLERNPPGKPKGIYITTDAGVVPFLFDKDGKVSNPLALGKSLIAAGGGLNPTSINEQYIIKELPRFLGKTIEQKTGGTGLEKERDVQGEYEAKVVNKITPKLFTGNKVKNTVSDLKVILKDVPGIMIEETHPNIIGNNTITIHYTDGRTPKTIEVNSNEGSTKATGYSADIQKILNALPAASKLKSIGKEKKGELD